MNKPDNSIIQSWLNGELEGDALREMEAWAEEHAEELEVEMGWESLAQEISESVPQNVEPPYQDFFNERVKLHALEVDEPANVAQPKPSIWQRLNWLLAPTALAGMAVCFYLGTQIESDRNIALPTLSADEVYTPVAGVSSEVVETEQATLIVLEGLDEIPESIDIVSGDSSFGVSPMMLAKAERQTYLF